MAIPHPQKKFAKIDLAKLGLKRPIHRPAVARLQAGKLILAPVPIAGELQPQASPVSCIPTYHAHCAPADSSNPPSCPKSDVQPAKFVKDYSVNRNLALRSRTNHSRAVVLYGVAGGRKRKSEYDLVLNDWAALHYFRRLTWEPAPEDYGSEYDDAGRRSSRRVVQRLLLTAGNSR